MILHCVEKDVIKLFLHDIMPWGVFLRLSACVQIQVEPTQKWFSVFCCVDGGLDGGDGWCFIHYSPSISTLQSNSYKQWWTYFFCSSLTPLLLWKSFNSEPTWAHFSSSSSCLQMDVKHYSHSPKRLKHECKWAALRAVVLMIQSAETCWLSLCRP